MGQERQNSAPSRGTDLAGLVPYALIVGAVLLAWQIVLQPVIQRAPVEAAIRIAPGSPQVLRRAAEAELAASRNTNAASLGRDALARSPFDVRALRVVGLTEARAGRLDAADQILTLAGNWSLRDDPAHAWLVEQRLRRGDYVSAFAHADTLVRRREDIQPQIFNLFSTAAAADPQRVLPVLTGLLAANPPWRVAYLNSLPAAEGGLQTAANLAITLQAGTAPLTNAELQEFYIQAMAKGQVGVVTAVRARLNRPAAGAAVTNGGFDDPTAPVPFQWTLVQKAGASAEVTNDDTDPSNPALRVEYDGYSAASIAAQRVFLPPGRHRITFRSRTESGDPADRMAWALTCHPGGQALLSASGVTGTRLGAQGWSDSSEAFSVPAGCVSQWLELRGLPLDRRAPMVVWFDQIRIVPLVSASN